MCKTTRVQKKRHVKSGDREASRGEDACKTTRVQKKTTPSKLIKDQGSHSSAQPCRDTVPMLPAHVMGTPRIENWVTVWSCVWTTRYRHVFWRENRFLKLSGVSASQDDTSKFTLYTLLFITYASLFPLYSLLFALYHLLFTVYSFLFTLYSLLSTIVLWFLMFRWSLHAGCMPLSEQTHRYM